jgi:DNA-binding Lrp family transcriptional regulator
VGPFIYAQLADKKELLRNPLARRECVKTHYSLNFRRNRIMTEGRKQILRFLEKNSKINLSELAILLGTDEVSLANEIAEMEKERIICGYHTLIDWDKTGEEHVNTLIEVRVTPQRGQGFDKVAERIYKYPEVNAVYLISGSYDLLVSLEGKTLLEVSRFVSEKLSSIDYVMSTATHFILKKYKDHGTIIGQKSKEERMLVTP